MQHYKCTPCTSDIVLLFYNILYKSQVNLLDIFIQICYNGFVINNHNLQMKSQQKNLNISIDRNDLYRYILNLMVENGNEYSFEEFNEVYDANVVEHKDGHFEIIGGLFETVFERVKDGYDDEDEDCMVTHYPISDDYDGFDAYYDVEDEEVIDMFF